MGAQRVNHDSLVSPLDTLQPFLHIPVLVESYDCNGDRRHTLPVRNLLL